MQAKPIKTTYQVAITAENFERLAILAVRHGINRKTMLGQIVAEAYKQLSKKEAHSEPQQTAV